jgi:sigma-B regulation protein RsbU (phosphoserine phosphatase)
MSTPLAEQQDSSIYFGLNTDKAARALYALLELSKALSFEVDLQHLLSVIVDHASAVVDAERTLVFVYDPDAERLWSTVARGLQTTTIEVAIGSGVVGDVAKTLKLANTIDGNKSVLCAPVIDSKGKLLGVIESVHKASGERFDAHDESLMRALAAHVAVAMERARLTEVHVESERFEQSLRLASEIQMRMLPEGVVKLPRDARFAIRAHIRPAKQVGGDLYDFFWDDNRLWFCIGDVTGKGLGAALVMAVTKTLFRANSAFMDDPAKVMSAANARLHEDTDPSMFVTAFCGFIDLHSGRLLYSNAGHDRGLVVSAGKPVVPLETNAGLPLGVLPNFTYVVEEKILNEGDALFLYTDGVTEAVNRSDELFQMERLQLVLESCETSDPAHLVPAVLENVDRFAQGAEQADDLTMLCVQYRGGAR